MVFDYGKQVYTTVVLLLLCCRRALLLLSALVMCDRLLLFVYFQVNNGVVYLDYEDSTSQWSSVLVSMIVLDSSLLFDDVLFCLRCLSGVPAWRLM